MIGEHVRVEQMLQVLVELEAATLEELVVEIGAKALGGQRDAAVLLLQCRKVTLHDRVKVVEVVEASIRLPVLDLALVVQRLLGHVDDVDGVRRLGLVAPT